MPTLETILGSATDLRPMLPVKDNPPGFRKSRVGRAGPVKTVTVHFNGPPVSNRTRDGEIRQIVKIDAPNHIKRIGADSLQYHICVGSAGEYFYTRNLGLQAWHCGVYEGNEHSIAVHLPLGGSQDATPEQWTATAQLFDALIDDFDLAGRQAIRAHCEWKPSECPGVPLMRRLLAWRSALVNAPLVPAVATYRIVGSRGANVRLQPSSRAKLLGAYSTGEQVEVVNLAAGEKVKGVDQWAQLRDRGFIWLPLLTRL